MPLPRGKTRRRSPHQTEEENEAQPGDWDAISIYRRKYKIPSIHIDQSRWDKRWEKTLHTLSASKDVFPVLSPQWIGDSRVRIRAPFAGMSDVLHEAVCEFRENMMSLEDTLKEQSPFATMWLLLGEAERKRHLFIGMKETCEEVSLHYDGRALCPEITTTAMLKQNGKAFTDFARDFVKATKDAGADNVHFLPNPWWSSAVDIPEPWPETVKFVFTQLSIQRHEFMSHFIVNTLLSFLHDVSVSNPSVDKAMDLMETDCRAALSWAATLATKRDKPLIRCEHCTKTGEIGENTKFKVCGNCKHELDFVVHYCSRACQKEDWPNHKKHCGKEKIAKKLPGTIYDRSWAYPSPSDHFPFVDSALEDEVPITDFGFGTPHPSWPHSPALQRQVALIEGNREADYFLFNDDDRPIVVTLEDCYLKLAFRRLRSEAMFGPKQFGVEEMAELLIKIAADQPGFSRDNILAQFEREYGGNVAAKMAALEAEKAEAKDEHETYLEAMSAALKAIEAGGFPGLTL